MKREYFQIAKTRTSARAAEKLFRRERLRIRRRLPGAIIQHVGATAVRNLPSKGDLDIVVRVEKQDFARACRSLRALYDENRENIRTDDFASFKSDEVTPALGVQLVVIGSEHDDFDLLRDQLRVSARCRRSLARLKRRFHNRAMPRYREAKAAEISLIFMREPLATLLASRRSNASKM